MFRKLVFSEDGQSLVEYSLIISLVVLVAVGALFVFGKQIAIIYDDNKNKILSNLGG